VSKSEAEARVRQILDSVRAFLASPDSPRLSEADTRAEFIDPILGALGYRFGEIRREVHVKDTNEFLDYVLSPGGRRLVAVEAKAIDRLVGDKDAGQVVQYCAIEGIRWAVVTNGREWRLYDQFNRGPLAEKQVYRLDLIGWANDEEFDRVFDRLWLLSTQSFTDADGPASWVESRRIDVALRATLVDERSAEVRYLRKRLEDQGFRATATDVADWFAQQLRQPPIASRPQAPIAEVEPHPTPPTRVGAPPASYGNDMTGRKYWLVPAAARGSVNAVESIRNWLDHGMWGFWERTPGRKKVRAGDMAVFYAGKPGVVAYAEITGPADVLVQAHEWPEPEPPEPNRAVYKVPLTNVVWLPKPLPFDLALRRTLEAFKAHPADGNWSWLVQGTHRLSQADFERMIG
jgi:hypothetical protein